MLTERMILYMTEKQFMSGSELRQYLHISTRKMKYLMDNNYIPHENTGHTTHKYRVRTEDAVRFKARMDTEPGFLSELSGMFSNRTEWHPLPMFEATPENCEAFRRWLSSHWAELPDALPTQTAAELVGHSPQRIYEWIQEEALTGIKLGSIQYGNTGILPSSSIRLFIQGVLYPASSTTALISGFLSVSLSYNPSNATLS